MLQTGTRIHRVLLASPHDQLRATTSRLLQSVGHTVLSVATASDVLPFLRRQRVELVMLDVSRGAGADDTWRVVISELAARTDGSAPHVLALTRARDSEGFRSLFEQERLLNFVVVRDDETFDTVDLMATVSKILTGHVFGLHQYLGPEVTERTLRVQSSTQKIDAMVLAEESARHAGCNPRAARDIALVVDELVTNALYNAPVDHTGAHVFAHLDHRIPVTMEPGREVLVRFAWDNQRFGLSAEDSFGSLDGKKVLAYWKNCFLEGGPHIRGNEDGAGLGLYMIFHHLNHFVLNLKPGLKTEALGLVAISSSYKHVVSQGRSFNLFVEQKSNSRIVTA